ncbi:Dipeptide ABC transporter, substrate-binding protein DppA (TC 3.A.1.5.2), partial [Olavius algarvensis associated proteobacterium Delta 3]
VFERFADYWDNGSPGNVTKIILTPIKEDATRVASSLMGVRIILVTLPGEPLSQ